MNLHNLNSLSISEMKTIQEELRSKIIDSPYGKRPKLVSGVDISYNSKTNHSIAVIVTFDFKLQKLLDVTHAISDTPFRYQPGYLAFRELPPFLAAWEKLTINPDIVFFDGHG